jgi:prepilin-type N-terminal cleavage/methylation domain-containing protein
MLTSRRRNHAFTLIELLATITIIAVLVGAVVVYIPRFVDWSRQTSDKQTLTVLNDALTRYKIQGGGTSALTSGAPIANVLNRLRQPISWNGIVHQIFQPGTTYPSRSLDAIGSGASYNFLRFNSYASSTTRSLPAGISVVGNASYYWDGDTLYLYSGTLTLSSDLNGKNVVIQGGLLQISSSQNIGSLTIGSGGSVTLTGSSYGGVFLFVSTLSISSGSSMNLNAGVLIVQQGNLSGIKSLVTPTGTSGIYSSIVSSGDQSLYAMAVDTNETGVFVIPALKGDIDLNGVIDFDDQAVLNSNFGDLSGTATWSSGDINGDGNVDGIDQSILDSNYGSTF